MRTRVIVAFLMFALVAQTALAAVCAIDCASMTPSSAHHNSRPQAPAYMGSHHQHHGSAVQVAAASDVSAVAAKCLVPTSVEQWQRPSQEIGTSTLQLAKTVFALAARLMSPPSPAVRANFSPPSQSTVLRI